MYCGKDEVVCWDGSAKAICLELLEKGDLTGAHGRALFTDNWYTSVDLAKALWNKHRMLFCGTTTPTEKKS